MILCQFVLLVSLVLTVFSEPHDANNVIKKTMINRRRFMGFAYTGHSFVFGGYFENVQPGAAADVIYKS